MDSTIKDTYKYHVKVGKKVVARGITYDLNRREAEVQQTWPSSILIQIGRRTTRKAALKWERLGSKRPYKYSAGKEASLFDRLVAWFRRRR